MLDSVRATAQKINTFQIKGARNIAIAAVNAFKELALESRAQTSQGFMRELREAQNILLTSKDTEPLMHNAIHYLINQTQSTNSSKVETTKQTVVDNVNTFLKNLDVIREEIAEIGQKYIADGSIVFTHCYSSTVTHLIAKAKEKGKVFKVLCTETRPEFQGRITAKELARLGIDTTFIVDSAAQTFIQDVDLVIVGADAITSQGNTINKIGTSGIAVLAHESKKPFYVASELLKFDIKTIEGKVEKIEERNPKEVWAEAPKNLTIRNPAFDLTQKHYIDGFICEEGLITPQAVAEVTRKKYPWLFC